MIPNDSIMLLSYINTQLRDNYGSLDDLCNSLDISKEDLINKLGSISYQYNEDENKFIRQ